MARNKSPFRLQWFTANNAWAFTYGDQMLQLEGDDMFYEKKSAAIAAAKRHGLKVEKSGHVVSHGPNPFQKG